MAAKKYDESSVKKLRGIEPVQRLPGMYTRTSDPTHIIQEAIDNAADEAFGEHADRIDVTVHRDGSVTVADNGRGIPVGLHPEEKIPTVQLVFTELHAGAKFARSEADAAYKFSGGLHGVGVSVTNALSERLEVEVRREGGLHAMAFADGAVARKLKMVRSCAKNDTGTSVHIWPNKKYFDSPKVSLPDLERIVRSKAVLLPGVKVTLNIEGAKETTTRTWSYPDGMKGYLAEMLADAQPIAPVFEGEKYVQEGNGFAAGEGAGWAFAFVEEAKGYGESYANLIPTPAGGTHEAGLRDGLFEAIKAFADHHSLMPRGIKLQSDDVWSRTVFFLSAKVLEPQFHGQTKEKLSNRDAVKLVSSMVRDPFELWLSTHVEHGRKIAELAIRQAVERSRSVQKVERKKSSSVVILPEKLTDCESSELGENELYLVEGDSAGGSAKQARDKRFQAIYKMRGKALNSWEVKRELLFSNAEIHDIAVAVGVDPHGESGDPDLSGLRYGKIGSLTDADVDGAHISVLLLTLFYRHFPKLIERGHIYIACPPLYKVDIPGHGKRPARKLYALDDEELKSIRDRARDDGIRAESILIQRFKGLGEMNPGQLWETTLCPDTRRLLQVRIEDRDKTYALFNMLMSRKEAEQRCAWMEEKGDQVEADV
ncbi:MAG: type IIA DNA topoisomerase subunit B [Betaproteobacteria bacterium]|nr:type IIA DNA topoisomerase subunit B [Betaproteobacteria bacterium]MDH3437894.1 type IIA DNA topoisomerase subunit B [Betaproteobacteria bacterium]